MLRLVKEEPEFQVRGMPCHVCLSIVFEWAFCRGCSVRICEDCCRTRRIAAPHAPADHLLSIDEVRRKYPGCEVPYECE